MPRYYCSVDLRRKNVILPNYVRWTKNGFVRLSDVPMFQAGRGGPSKYITSATLQAASRYGIAEQLSALCSRGSLPPQVDLAHLDQKCCPVYTVVHFGQKLIGLTPQIWRHGKQTGRVRDSNNQWIEPRLKPSVAGVCNTLVIQRRSRETLAYFYEFSLPPFDS